MLLLLNLLKDKGFCSKRLTNIVFEESVKLKCFHCQRYKTNWMCPPDIPELEVFFSVFNVERVAWCEEIGVKRYKISAKNVENYVLQLAVLGTDKPVFMSLPYGERPTPTYYFRDDHFTFLYCVPEYPAPLEKIKIHGSWDCNGFSDHTIGIEVAKIYLANYRNTIIEKHFSIDHQTGVDAPWSMDASELKELVRWASVVNQVL